MAFGPIIANGLAISLTLPQQVDQRTSEEEPKNQRGEKGPSCPEGYIAEKVEEIPTVGKSR